MPNYLNAEQAPQGAAGPGAGLSRRSFLKVTGLAGGGLVLGFFVGGGQKMARAQTAAATPVNPNAFLRIAPDNTITIAVNRLEFGQGVATSLPMLIAEELEADWSRVNFELAPASPVFNDPVFGFMLTGGSSSVANSWQQYREIGAAARQMLILAAASHWQVQPAECHAAQSRIIGPLGLSASFGELAELAMRQNVEGPVALKPASAFRLIGQPTRRIDARAKIDGSQQFGIDFHPDGCKVVLIARAPVFAGKVAGFDAGAALAVKGVSAVFKIPTDRGGTGLAVVADGYWPASQARALLKVQWSVGNLDKVSSDTQRSKYLELARTPGTVAVRAAARSQAVPDKKISAEYEFPYLAHAPMEPLNCVIELGADGCNVWAGSQSQTFDQRAVARVLGISPEQVKFHTMMAGGGFGRRATPSSDYLTEAAEVAKAWQAQGQTGPLKIMWSREDDLHGGYYRPSHVHRVDVGLDRAGKVLYWDHVVVGQSINAGTMFEGESVKNGVDQDMIDGLSGTYDLPMNLSVHNVVANVPVLWFRSVGNTHTAYVMETMIDQIAQASGTDPVALRTRLLGNTHPRHLAALQLAVQISGYPKAKLPKGHAFGVAVHGSFDSVVAYVVEASVNKGVPRLHRVWAGVHCNQAVNPLTIEAQVQGAALMALGTTLQGAAITFKDGVVQQNNFNDYTVPRMSDMPKIEVAIVPSADPPTGMGEPGLPPLAPAYANALARLTGKHLVKLPFDLS